MFINIDADRLALALRDGDRNDLARQPAAGLRRGCPLLAAQRESVLIVARNVKFLGNVLRRFRHGIDAMELPHQRIDQPPANRRILHRRDPRKGAFSLRHDKGRPRHGFHPAGDHQLRLTGLDRPRGGDDSVHARPAQPVDGRPRHAVGQAGKQQAHAGDIAIVLAGLVDAAEDDIIDHVPIQVGMPRHQRFQRHGAEIVGANAGKRPGKAANRRADIIADKSLSHGSKSRFFYRPDALLWCGREDRAVPAIPPRSAAAFQQRHRQISPASRQYPQPRWV